MRGFIVGTLIAIVIAGVAAIVSNTVDLSARDVYQSHSGSVRL
jgi:hypothetical protein